MAGRLDSEELWAPRRRRGLLIALAVFGLIGVTLLAWTQSSTGPDASDSVEGPAATPNSTASTQDDPTTLDSVAEPNAEVAKTEVAKREVAKTEVAKTEVAKTEAFEDPKPVPADEVAETVDPAKPVPTVEPTVAAVVLRREGAEGSALERRSVDLVSASASKAPKPRTRPSVSKVRGGRDQTNKPKKTEPADTPSGTSSSPLMEPK